MMGRGGSIAESRAAPRQTVSRPRQRAAVDRVRHRPLAGRAVLSLTARAASRPASSPALHHPAVASGTAPSARCPAARRPRRRRSLPRTADRGSAATRAPPLEPGAPVADPGELAPARVRSEPSDEPQRDRLGPPPVGRPRLADVDLAAHEHRPGGADRGGERRVGLGHARAVVVALLAVRAVPTAFDGATHDAAFCYGAGVRRECRSRQGFASARDAWLAERVAWMGRSAVRSGARPASVPA